MSCCRKILVLFLCVPSLTSYALFGKPSEPSMATLPPIKTTLKVDEQWSTNVGGAYKRYLKLIPAIEGNRIYTVSYKGSLAAIDTQTGRNLWETNTKKHLTSGVDVSSGTILVGSNEGEALAFDVNNGKRLWSSTLSNEILATPYIINDTALFKSADDHLYALDLKTGQALWNYQEPLPELILRGGNSPRATHSLAVTGFADGEMAVFSLENGQMLWKRPVAEAKGSSVVARMIDMTDNIEILDNVIYSASYQGNVVAVDLHTGRLLWQRDMSSYAGLAVNGSRVFVVDADSHVWALNRHTGEVLWHQDKLFRRRLTAPSVIGEAVVVADSKGYVHWLSAQDGSFVARSYVDGKGVLATPIVNGNAVYVYGSSGRLVKYSVS